MSVSSGTAAFTGYDSTDPHLNDVSETSQGFTKTLAERVEAIFDEEHWSKLSKGSKEEVKEALSTAREARAFVRRQASTAEARSLIAGGRSLAGNLTRSLVLSYTKRMIPKLPWGKSRSQTSEGSWIEAHKPEAEQLGKDFIAYWKAPPSIDPENPLDTEEITVSSGGIVDTVFGMVEKRYT